jgi:hypothetical protein
MILKELSHEIDLACDDMYIVSSTGLNRGRGQCLKFLTADFKTQNSVFLVVNASYRWLNNVVDVYLVQVSLLLICQKGLGDFFRYRPLLPIGWRCKFYADAGGKQTMQRQLLLNSYASLVISRNDKNKPTLTRINRQKYTFCNIKSLEHPKMLKNGPVLYLGLKLTIHVMKSKIHLVRQSPLPERWRI